MLIALAILAVISTLGYRAVSALVDSEAQLTSESLRWRTLDALFARLESDLRQALPREARVGADRAPAWLADVDSGGNTALRGLPRRPRVRRRTPAPPVSASAIGSMATSSTVLYWPQLDRPAGACPVAHALAAGVAAFRLQFLDTGGAWRDALAGAGRARAAARGPRRARRSPTAAGSSACWRCN